MLSEDANKIFTFLKEKFIKEGYCFHGSISIKTVMDVLGTFDFKRMNEALDELEQQHLIEKSEYETFAIQLANRERKDLMAKHNLEILWLTDKRACYLLDKRP